MGRSLQNVVNLKLYPLSEGSLRIACKETLDSDGVLVLPNFLHPSAVAFVRREGEDNSHLAYYTASKHNIYLEPPSPEYPSDHPRNREVSSSKGCITTDQIPSTSALHTLYDAPDFRDFLCAVLDVAELHGYADALSSINLHYASEGQELGWHFDNSSFAITLMIQNPESGAAFQYVKNVRDAARREMNFERERKVLDGEWPTETLSIDDGALVLFRGRNSMHRVTPAKGTRTRMLVVLAYNTEPGISLSRSARMTFYGRL